MIRRALAVIRGADSPTRTRTLNLAVNSRSLYRLSYRGICPDHTDQTSETQGQTTARNSRKPPRTQQEASMDGNHGVSRAVVNRGKISSRDVNPGLDLLRSAYGFLVMLDRLLEQYPRSGRSTRLCLPSPSSRAAHATREACGSGSGRLSQAWNGLLNIVKKIRRTDQHVGYRSLKS